MASRKTIEEQIEIAREEARQIENRLNELIREKKIQDEKARTHRLCKRAGYIESCLPETVTLTDKQFFTFIEETVLTDFARKILNRLIAQSDKPDSKTPVETSENAPEELSE